MQKRPKIGMTTRLDLEYGRFYMGRHYSEAIEGSGGIPFQLSLIPKRDYIREALKTLDGVLLPGSDTDVDPMRFGEEPHTKLKKVISEKDETDLLVIEEAEKLNLPILAICFGMQVLNVARGGSLIQDIEAQTENSLRHEQGIPLERNSHSLEIKNGSLLSKLAETEITQVNSHHHQAIKEIGSHLKANAWAKDGVIEGIEDVRAEKFILGVQWHPELSWQNDSLSRNIFKTFVGACANGKIKRS
jgi:putative glutamine amidotransferase